MYCCSARPAIFGVVLSLARSVMRQSTSQKSPCSLSGWSLLQSANFDDQILLRVLRTNLFSLVIYSGSSGGFGCLKEEKEGEGAFRIPTWISAALSSFH